ncbi:MAG: hypothetical protein ACU83V_05645 [Gammaproteobacteria bacterium]
MQRSGIRATCRHVVVRDSGSKRDRRAVSVEADQRWTMSQVATSIQAVSMGFGFAWQPEEHIREELKAGLGIREVPLYLIFANPDFVGPGVNRLAEIIRRSVRLASQNQVV